MRERVQKLLLSNNLYSNADAFLRYLHVKKSAHDFSRLQAVEAIDAERDVLQGELDSKAELVANLTEELDLGHQQADSANRCCSSCTLLFMGTAVHVHRCSRTLLFMETAVHRPCCSDHSHK